MNKLFKTIGAVVITLGISSQVSAQKIAHIRTDSLIQVMPESKKAEELLKGFYSSLEKDLAAMKTDFDKKYQDFIAYSSSPDATETGKKMREAELQDMDTRMQTAQQNAQQEYQLKQQEFSKPIYEKMRKAIEAVAKENGYKYVLDYSTGNVLYAEDADNIFTLVKKKLDSMPVVNIGGEAPKPTPPGTKPAPKSPTPKGTGK